MQAVDWFPWGEDAFERALNENKPVFLSIGSLGCLWSQRMAEENFEDVDVADFLNQNFICVLVDKEERPEIADIYSEALKALTGGRSSWPINLFLTPQKLPYFGGSYFSNQSTFGKPSFSDVCKSLLESFLNENHTVLSFAEDLSKNLKEAVSDCSLRKVEDELADSALNSEKIKKYLSETCSQLTVQLAADFDHEQGGFNQLPKSPEPARLAALLFSGEKKSVAAALLTLDKIRCGGITDQVEGGVFRTTSDTRWMSPQFEKNLEDNAQLLWLFAAGSVFLQKSNPEKSEDFRQTAKDIFNFLDRKLRCSRTGFYFSSESSALDAEDGKEYTIEFETFFEAFAGRRELFDFATAFFGVSKKGQINGANVLSRPASLEAFCKQRGISAPTARMYVGESLSILESLRKQNQSAQSSGLIVLAGNALLASNLLRAAQLLGESQWLDRGLEVLDSLWSCFLADKESPAHQILDDDGVSGGLALADDLGFSLRACVDAFCVTGRADYAQRARQIVKWLHASCVDPAQGTLFYAPQSSDVFTRPLQWVDGQTPSCASVIFESCRTYLAVCAAGGVLSKMEPAEVKMWEALELVALATFAGRARRFPRSCATGLSAVRWSVSQNVCVLDATRAADPHHWLNVARSFWQSCLVPVGLGCVLSNHPALEGDTDRLAVAADSEPRETLPEFLPLALCTARGCYESTVNYAEIIDQIRIYSEPEG